MKIIRLKDVIEITGLSRSTIYARMSIGEFPVSVNLGGNAVGWVSSEVCAWLENRITERDERKNQSLNRNRG